MADERTQRFTELYRRFAPAVFRRAASLLGGDEAAAQDVTQEVFLGYFKNEGRLRGEASPFTVLYQMATYQAVDRLRHRARWHGSLQALPHDEAALDEVAQLPSSGSALERVDAMHDLASRGCQWRTPPALD
jgi:RNA polymerase sigma-70 factor (ECF subfamily)